MKKIILALMVLVFATSTVMAAPAHHSKGHHKAHAGYHQVNHSHGKHHKQAHKKHNTKRCNCYKVHVHRV